MTEHVRRSRKALALWGGSAVLVAGTGLWTAAGSTATAAGSTGTRLLASGGQDAGTCGTCEGNAGQGAGNGAGTGSPGKALVVSATAAGRLAPGVDDVVSVVVRNPNAAAVRIRRVTGSVTSVTATVSSGPVDCRLGWFQLDDYAGGAVVAGGASGTVPMRLRFVNRTDTNQDRCKGARFAFAVTATADQIGKNG